MGKNQHVVRRGKDWAVLGEGNSRDTSHHQTQGAAHKAASRIAKNEKSEVVIHGRDGRIRNKNSFGNDPVPPRDQNTKSASHT